MIYFVMYSVFLLCCIPFQFRDSDEAYLDKKCTDWIRGVAILVIVIHHGVQHYEGFQFLYPFQVLGYGAVAVFLLLSGYGLEQQYRKRHDYLDGFLKNKILRLYLTFWCAYTLLLIGAMIGGAPVSQEKAIMNLLTMSILDTSTWYIKIQVLLYILFFFVFRRQIDEKQKLLLLFGVCCVYVAVCASLKIKQYWWFTTVYFPAGVLVAYSRPVVIKWLKRWSIPGLVSACVMLLGIVVLRFFKGNMGHALLMDAVITATFVLVLFLLSYQIKFLSRPVEYIGQMSLELYLVHGILLTDRIVCFSLDSVLSYILYIMSSIVGAALVRHSACSTLKLLLNKKQKNIL